MRSRACSMAFCSTSSAAFLAAASASKREASSVA
eukprot:CAMPEP_0204157718 /NCGR_PEP_ID=MMETSP0361-20130328/31480_1 /ASSEMBLY_ACC=CAM_ASM_000343 /TAXON_ID=268821 /ORGANISM="Scrippsiella Hangoei, Strain SHTV-5" /LENGTH=33 /DNA_ID= /DNA_START= /DNA_END= /DNA_ORIENTATION=